LETSGLLFEPDRRMLADSDDLNNVVVKFSKLSSLFTRKPLWTLGSFRKTLFTSEFIYPRESRCCKRKSWHWMRRLTAYFEHTVVLHPKGVRSEIVVCPICSLKRGGRVLFLLGARVYTDKIILYRSRDVFVATSLHRREMATMSPNV